MSTLIRRNAAGAFVSKVHGQPRPFRISALLTDQDIRVRNEAERAIDHLRLVAA